MIPEGYIGKYYEMDPAIEDLLFDANYLQNEMVVVADVPLRYDITKPPETPEDEEQARKFNRWFRVSHILLIPNNNSVHMMATYADGTKKKISVPLHHAWLVRKNSIPGAAQYDQLGSNYASDDPLYNRAGNTNTIRVKTRTYDTNTGEQATSVFRFAPSETGVLDKELDQDI